MTPDIVKVRFGRLLVLEVAGKNKRGKALWSCQCDCGNITVVLSDNVKNGHTKSCGCLRRESSASMLTKHGYRKEKQRLPEYRIWSAMKERCSNPNNNRFYRYGGRGIAVCKEWQESFEQFINDMGHRPGSKHSIDRIDNDGNYEPNNCRWATRIEQARQKIIHGRYARKEVEKAKEI